MELDRDDSPGVTLAESGERQLSRGEFNKRLAVGIAGLAVAGTLPPLAGAKPGAGKAISVGYGAFEKPGFEALRKVYAKTPGAVTAKLAPISSNVYVTILPRQLQAGNAADVFQVAAGGGLPIAVNSLAPARHLADLSKEPWVKNIPKSILPVCSHNGKVYMCPITGGVMVVFYNKGLFKRYAIKPPTTWPEFLAVCAKLKAQGKIPIWLDASNASNGGVNPLFLTYPLASSTDAGTANWPARRRRGEVSFAKSGWRLALQRFKLLYDREYFSPNATGGAPLAQLADGDAAMYCFVSQGYPTAKEGFGNNNVGTFVLPNANQASKVVASAGSGYGLGVNAKSGNIAAAKAFVAASAGPLGQKGFNLAGGGVPLLPAAKGAVPTPFNPVLPVLRAGRTATYFDQQWPNNEVQRALITGTVELMTGQKTVAEVLEGMDKAYDRG